MDNIYVICDITIKEPHENAISILYSLAAVKKWRFLSGSTTSDHVKLGMKIKDFKKYYDEYPVRGKTYDGIGGFKKFVDHVEVKDIRDLTL